MKNNRELILYRGKKAAIDEKRFFSSTLEYQGIQDSCFRLIYDKDWADECRIDIPLERAGKPLLIHKYIFLVEEILEEKIRLKRLMPKDAKEWRNTYKC